jgi:hypothetical protein
VRDTPDRQVEFYSENFDMLSDPNSLSPSDLRESLVKQYGNQKFGVVVAVGPDTIEFLREYGQSVFLDVPNCHLWEFRRPGRQSQVRLQVHGNVAAT